MAENHTPQNDDLDIQNIEIEPLSDEALEDVAGGTLSDSEAAVIGDSCGTCCSCSGCS